MTTSAFSRSVSRCHTYSARHPRSSVATWWQSWSQLDPGKTTIAKSGLPLTIRLEAHVVSLDHRVGEKLLRHPPSLRLDYGRIVAADVQEENLAGADVLDRPVTQALERRRDGSPLRVEYTLLGIDADLHLHASNVSYPSH